MPRTLSPARQYCCRSALVVLLVAVLLPATALGADRMVLGENFTATWCVYCPRADAALDMMLEDFSDTFTIVQYHVTDSFQTAFGDGRITFYGLSGTPTTWFDGELRAEGAQPTIPLQYDWYVLFYQNRLAIPCDTTIDLSGQQVAGSNYDITAQVCIDDGGAAKTMRIHTVQTIDHWPVVTGHIYRNGVKQAASPAIITVNPGECVDVVSHFNFDAVSMDRQEDIKIVVWAQKVTTAWPAEIYQAAVLSWPFESQAACPHADVNEDGISDGFDIAIIRNGANWLMDAGAAAEPRCDVNGDGIIDGFDIAVVRSGTCWLQ